MRHDERSMRYGQRRRFGAIETSDETNNSSTSSQRVLIFEVLVPTFMRNSRGLTREKKHNASVDNIRLVLVFFLARTLDRSLAETVFWTSSSSLCLSQRAELG